MFLCPRTQATLSTCKIWSGQIGCHAGAFASFGGAMRQIAGNNLKAAFAGTGRYELWISPNLAGSGHTGTHHGTAILPV
jgi:hypothetical protein